MKQSIEMDVAKASAVETDSRTNPSRSYHPLLGGTIVISAILFILCLLLSQIPLKLSQSVINVPLSPSHLLSLFKSWHNLTPSYVHDPWWSRHILEFLALVWLACMLYLLAAYLLTRLPASGRYYRSIRLLIWIVTLLGGLAFLFSPSMLSHDIFSYASYGRLQVIYHANPYLTSPSHFPQDPFIDYNDWRKVLSTYGPFWQTICNLLAFPIGGQRGYAILIYRLLGLVAHLLNTLLIGGTLHASGRSPRTTTLGMLLYAWNPLVLEESCLGGHNDVLMLLFILLAFFLDVRLASQRNRLLASLPPLTALTLSFLVKFSAAPILALYLILLARRACGSFDGNMVQQIKRAALTIIPAGTFCVLVALAWYLPYWINMTPTQIIHSFATLPSAELSYGSILASLTHFQHTHSVPAWMSFLTSRNTWSIASAVTLVCLLVLSAIWLWRSPSLPTLAAASIATLSALLVVTAWFFPWYLVWTVGMAGLILPLANRRLTRALLAFSLAFSLSALSTYIYANTGSSFGGWNSVSIFTTLPFSILIFLLVLMLSVKSSRQTG